MIPMTLFGSIVLALNLLLQAGGVPSGLEDILNFPEKAKLSAARSLNDRIKVYTEASQRIQLMLQYDVSKDNFDPIPGVLKLWTSLLDKSLEDIDASLKPKQRPKNLKKFEIHLRIAIKDMQSQKIKAPADQQDDFEACLARAEAVRKRFVEILFLH